MAEASELPGDASSASSHVPDDSTIRILLLGRSGSGKSSSGNTILGQKAFISPKRYKEKVTRTCEEHTAVVGGRKVCVIDTPDLLDPDLSEEELDGEKEKLLSLCQSGLHAVLLVLPIGKGLQNEEEMLEFTKDLLGPDLQRFTMALFTRGDELEDEETIEQHIQEEGEELKQLVEGCHGRHVFTNTQADQKQVLHLLDMIETLVKRNKGSVFRRRMSMDCIINFSAGPEGASDPQPRPSGKEQRRLVLLGKTGAGKSATGNTILGKNLLESEEGFSSQTRECTSKKIERAGKEITVIDTPGLFDTRLDQNETMREIVNCLAYSSPGPHAFLIVIRIGRFTKEERETVMQLERVFGANAKRYTMILFTCRDKLERKNQTIQQFLEKADPELKALVESCGNRFCCFNNHHVSFQQFKGLMDEIDSMVAANEVNYYSNETFQGLEQAIVVLQKEKLEEKLKSYSEEEKHQSKWQKIYRRLLKESRNEAETTLIHKTYLDTCAIIIAKCLGKIPLTSEEMSSAILEAVRQGVDRTRAVTIATAATAELARENLCVIL